MTENGRGEETPGQAYKRVLLSAARHLAQLETSIGDPLSGEYLQARAGLATDRDEFRMRFIRGDSFDEMRTTTFWRLAMSRADEMRLVRNEFPNQFPPEGTIVNFDNHAFKKDVEDPL